MTMMMNKTKNINTINKSTYKEEEVDNQDMPYEYEKIEEPLHSITNDPLIKENVLQKSCEISDVICKELHVDTCNDKDSSCSNNSIHNEHSHLLSCFNKMLDEKLLSMEERIMNRIDHKFVDIESKITSLLNYNKKS